MDVERRASKGGFLQLFDWNAKSRKKLFSNKSELPESSKQGYEKFANSAILHPVLTEMYENGPGPSGKRDSQYNCASSVISDEGYGTKAPGVVARLMGLDSLPTLTISDPCPTPFCDSPFVGDSYSQRSTSKFQIEHQIVTTMPNGEISRNLVEPKLLKVQNRPIERFQTETLPPKSAKSIPITHHRMLSPIKNPGFIPRNNAAYIIDAAAKIIEQGHPSRTKGKMPCYGSSSVPSRILDLKEKMESAQKASGAPDVARRPKVPISFEYNKLQHSEKNHSGSRETQHYNASVGSVKNSSDTLKNKGKSVSLAVQAKVNIQSRASSSTRSSINRKEDEGRLGKDNKSQRNIQRSVQKKTSTARTSDVLKQNNQKQNCVANTDREASKTSVSNQQDRKASSSNDSVRPNKASNKVPNSATGSRKINHVAKDTAKKILSSKTKTSLENKQPCHRNIHSEEIVGKTLSFSKDEKSVKCNVTNDVCLNWDIVDSKSSMDVVSFTFTSPIKRSAPGPQSSGQVMEQNPRYFVDSSDEVGGDALSVLLEQKLKELSCRVKSSDSNHVDGGSASCSAFSLQDSMCTLNVIYPMSKDHHNSFQLHPHKDNSSHPHDIHCASVDDLLFKAKQNWQGLADMEGHSSSSNNSEYGRELDFRYPSPISNLEPSSSGGSYNSSDCKTSSITIGCKQSLLAEAHEKVDHISASQPVEIEIELSESASSASAACVFGNEISPTFTLIDFKRSSNWELDYITKILHNSDLNIEDFALGRVNKVITTNLFDQLENPKTGYDENAEEYFKHERKVLFDGVSECLELRSEQVFGGSYKACSNWEIIFQRNGCLGEELYKEISSWKSMGECDWMVDELVDKDMSSWLGRWVDFGIEAFEEGAEIENGILTSLVDELVADFLLS